MAKILGDKELKLLRTKIIYNELDNATEDCRISSYYMGAKFMLDNDYGLHGVSDKILRALCYVNKKILTEALDSDICNFLYYWLGDILSNKLKPISLYHSVILTLFTIFKKINDKEQFCNAPTYYKIEEARYFNDIKLFFDYSKDYDIYVDELDTQNPPLCNEEYHKYLQKYVTSYKAFQAKCPNGPSPHNYCNAFNKYFHEKDRTKLSNWTCKMHDKIQEAEKELVAEEPQLPAVHGMSIGPVTIQNELSPVSGEEEHLDSSVHPSSEGKSELNSDSGHADEPSISITTKTIATTATVAGILVPPFLVYNVISITIVKLIVLFYI
ncbi:hypothetical protein PVMG_05966 [Plasmodium vivax Mauritania I]|uniref:Uncharacterized protein n=1 Tax=Plasmodium vivax Mauritania I TaxID=1035515 RepID=A0A0J9TIN0_PLAVI|nr:hypothetical protein PVMG_05966 [Plasmodium vivax Mauritania I]